MVSLLLRRAHGSLRASISLLEVLGADEQRAYRRMTESPDQHRCTGRRIESRFQLSSRCIWGPERDPATRIRRPLMAAETPSYFNLYTAGNTTCGGP